MANRKVSPVSYRPFQAQSILADGLLAVDRPGGEVAREIAAGLFGLADSFRQDAERTALRRAEQKGKNIDRPKITVSGGGVAEADPPAAAADAPAGTPREDRAPPGTYVPAAPKSRNMADVPAPVQDAIGQAAARHGVSPAALFSIARLESGLDPGARNPASSAGGLFQQVDANARQYGVRNRFDPYQSADGAARFLRDNQNYLRKALGREPTVGELYLAHQQGPGGAARLLKNPQASAASIVGAEAVRLNGGQPGMTAGQFASLWTRKAGGATAAAAPVSGVSRRSPLSIQVEGGSLRLTGRDTIFGRAYDEAAGATFKSALEDEMLDASAQIYDKLKDDPAALSAAFGELKAAQLGEHVPANIARDYERGFDKVAGKYLRAAQKQYDQKIEAQDRGAFNAETERLAESFSRGLAGIDPENEDSGDIAAAEGARFKDHIQEGVRRGYVTQAEADKQARAIDVQVQVQFHVKQAEGKSPAAIEAMAEQIREDYAAGKTGLDADGFNRVQDALSGIARTKRGQQAAAQKSVADTAASMIDRSSQGYDIAPAELQRFRAAAEGIDGGAEIIEGTEQTLELAKALRTAPVAEAEKKLDGLRKKTGNTPTARQAAVLAQAEAMVAQTRKSIATDLLGHAANAGVIADPGTVADIKDAGDVEGFIAKRLQLADEAARRFGVARRMFRPGEVAALDALVKADPAQGAIIAGGIVTGAGRQAQGVLKEFGKTAPVLAGAGMIIASGGDIRAAGDAIAGSGKTADGKPYPAGGEKARRAMAEEIAGRAFEFQPGDGARVMQAAEWITRKRLLEQGIEYDAPEAQEVHARALNEAAGAIFDGDVQWGGFTAYDPGFWASEQKVLVPNGIRADRLADVIGALRNGDLPVGPYGGMEALPDYFPVLTAGGYVFVDFDAEGGPVPLLGTDDKPFVLDLEKLAPKLAPRVPGAFRGY